MSAFTLLQAQTQLNAWLAADIAVASGQSYEIAGRRLVRANAAEITQKIQFWEAKVNDIAARTAGRTRSRSMSVGF